MTTDEIKDIAVRAAVAAAQNDKSAEKLSADGQAIVRRLKRIDNLLCCIYMELTKRKEGETNGTGTRDKT